MKYLSIAILLFLFSCIPTTIVRKTTADNTSYIYPSVEKIISQIHITESIQDTSTDNTSDVSPTTEKIIYKIQKISPVLPISPVQNAFIGNTSIVLPSGDKIIYQTQKTLPLLITSPVLPISPVQKTTIHNTTLDDFINRDYSNDAGSDSTFDKFDNDRNDDGRDETIQ